jgi:nicotinamide riboside kinase
MREAGVNVGLVDDVVRSCPFPINETTIMSAQNWILDQCHDNFKGMQPSHDVVVVDGPILHNFAYWKRIAERSGMSERGLSLVQDSVFRKTSEFDLLLFMQPHNVPIVDDNFRSTDPAWRQEMHWRIQALIDDFRAYNVPVVTIEGSEEEVLEQAMKLISKGLPVRG